MQCLSYNGKYGCKISFNYDLVEFQAVFLVLGYRLCEYAHLIVFFIAFIINIFLCTILYILLFLVIHIFKLY